MGEFSDQVFAIVAHIPRGRVCSYGQVARLMGRPRSGRYVGYALRGNPSPGAEGAYPCHRVVHKDGELAGAFAFGGPGVQRALLEAEGVAFLSDGRVDMDACAWFGDVSSL
ncbi:MGMT family protein [Curtanaerobium respiraculi]|uniref:MGMT family protein n=1 Tax=Curtanaerobium respiraculi TaxID=2949669 RepID=UPI0024B39BD1|nr:MGMT family protein [Curtanaerobium respiraculi]